MKEKRGKRQVTRVKKEQHQLLSSFIPLSLRLSDLTSIRFLRRLLSLTQYFVSPIFRSFILSFHNFSIPSFLRSLVLPFLYFFLPTFLHSQNLVYNPGFESDSGAVIHDYSQLRAGSTLVDGWYVPTDGTSDYFNSHSSTIKGHPIPKARTGQGRVAMIWANARQMPYREFITGRLIKPLEKNKKYRVSFYICRYKYAHYSPMQIAAYFSKDSVLMPGYYGNIKVLPRAKVEDYTLLSDRKYWHKVEAVFLADGGERFITLGNFKQTINDLTSPSVKVSNKWTIVGTKEYAYCFIDDVTVEEYNEEETVADKQKLYLFLVDKSTSMKRQDKFERMKKGVKRAVKKLPADADFAIMAFSNDTKVVLPPTKAVLYDLASAIDTVKIKGQTNAIEAVNFACDFASANNHYDVELIMCTDGQFQLDDSIYVKVIRTKMHFNLLQLGGMRNAYLEKLMNSTGGKYVVALTKNSKDEIISLTNSVSETQSGVEYTKANKGKVLLKYTLILSLIAVVAFAI